MTCKERPSPWPCPAWSACGGILPGDPDKGFAETLMVAGTSDRPGSQPLAVLIETWVPAPNRAAPSAAWSPGHLVPGFLDGIWGPHLTPAFIRSWAASQPQPRPPEPVPAGGNARRQ